MLAFCGERLQNWIPCSPLWPLSTEGSLSCHTCYDTRSLFCALNRGIDPKLGAFWDKQGGSKDLHFLTQVPNVERIDGIHLITYVVWFRVPVEVEVMRCFLWEFLEMTDIWKWMTLYLFLAFSSISNFCSFAPRNKIDHFDFRN